VAKKNLTLALLVFFSASTDKTKDS